MDLSKLLDELNTSLKKSARRRNAALAKSASGDTNETSLSSPPSLLLIAQKCCLPKLNATRHVQKKKRAFDARPGSQALIAAINRGERPGGELETEFDQYAARCRAANARQLERELAASNAFAPYKERLEKAEQSLAINKRRAEHIHETEERFVGAIQRAIEERECCIGNAKRI